ERPGVDGGDAGAGEQVRDVERAAVGADAGAPRVLGDRERGDDGVFFRIDLADDGAFVTDDVDRRAVGGGDHAGGRGSDGDRGEDGVLARVDDEDLVGGLGGAVALAAGG